MKTLEKLVKYSAVVAVLGLGSTLTYAGKAGEGSNNSSSNNNNNTSERSFGHGNIQECDIWREMDGSDRYRYIIRQAVAQGMDLDAIFHSYGLPFETPELAPPSDPLMVAIFYRDLGAVRVLIEYGVNPVGIIERANTLLDQLYSPASVDRNVAAFRTEFNEFLKDATPFLQEAAIQYEHIRLLVDTFIRRVGNINIQTLSALLDSFASLSNSEDTFFRDEVYRLYAPCARHLVDRLGGLKMLDRNIFDGEKTLPMQAMGQRCYRLVSEWIFSFGINAEIKDANGNTLRDYFIEGGKDAFMALLKKITWALEDKKSRLGSGKRLKAVSFILEGLLDVGLPLDALTEEERQSLQAILLDLGLNHIWTTLEEQNGLLNNEFDLDEVEVIHLAQEFNNNNNNNPSEGAQEQQDEDQGFFGSFNNWAAF